MDFFKRNLLLIILFTSLNLWSQVDSTIICEEADTTYWNHDYKSALSLYEACDILFLNENQKAILDLRMGLVKYRLKDYSSSESLLKKAKNHFDTITNSVNRFAIYQILTNIDFIKGDLTSAENNSKKSVEIAQELYDTSRIADGILNLTNIYLRSGKMDLAQENLSKGMRYVKGMNSKNRFHILYTKGILYFEKGNFVEAVNIFNKLLNPWYEINRNNIRNKAITENALGSSFLELRKYDEAVEHFQKSKNLYLEFAPEENYDDLDINFASCHFMAGNFFEALNAFENIEVRSGLDIRSRQVININFVRMYHYLGNDDKVAHYLNEFLKVRNNHPELELWGEGEMDVFYAEFLAKNKNHEKAFQVLDEINDKFNSRKNVNPRWKLKGDWLRAKLLFDEGHIEEAQAKVLGLNSAFKLEENTKKYFFPFDVLQTKTLLAKIFLSKWKNGKDEFLIKGENLLDECMEIIETQLKLDWLEKSSIFSDNPILDVSEMKLDLLYDIWAKNKNYDNFFNFVFHLEKYKNAKLLIDLNASKDLVYSKMSDDEINNLQQLEINLERLKSELFVRNFEVDDKTDELRSKFIEKNAQFHHFKDSLLQVYGEDLFAKPNLDIFSLDLTNEDHESKMFFFLGEHSFYSAGISSKGSRITKQPIDPVLERINKYISVFDEESSDADYLSMASDLYKTLLLPFEDILKEKIVLFPDKELSFISFDALLMEDVEKENVFRRYPYAIKKYLFSYGVHVPKKEKKKFGFVGFAPAFSLDIDSIEPVFVKQLFSKFEPLSYNLIEVKNSSKLFNGKIFSKENATKKKFIDEISNFGIVHVATHSTQYFKKGYQSILAFSNIPDGKDNELVFANELASMNLNNNLVVLSSCGSGLGKLDWTGDELSLSNAFFKSGASTVVSSLWSIDDKSTNRLMKLFYEGILGGNPIDEAMRSAKLNYLNNSSNLVASPRFWASFIVKGDVESISNSDFFSVNGIKILVFSLILLVFAFIFFFFYKKKYKK